MKPKKKLTAIQRAARYAARNKTLVYYDSSQKAYELGLLNGYLDGLRQGMREKK